MAYIDDRAWCHGKVVGLTDKAFRVWVSSITYSSGMNTLGRLDSSQQKLVGTTKKTRQELLDSTLWDDVGEGTICVHDWDDYNGKRDERKARDRDRKRLQRQEERANVSAGQTADSPKERPPDKARTVHDLSAHLSEVSPRVRGRAAPPDDGSEGSEGNTTRAVTSTEPPAPDPETNGPGDIDFDNILKAVDW